MKLAPDLLLRRTHLYLLGSADVQVNDWLDYA